MSKSSDKRSLLDLDDDCLIQIFENCDVETLLSLHDTCRCFRDIVKQYHFPKTEKFVCEIHHDSNWNQFRRIAVHTGKYLKHFHIDVRHNMERYEEEVRDTYLPYLKEFAKFIGDNIRCFYIDVECIPNSWMPALGPILSHVETIIITTNNRQFEFDFDIHSRAPKLKHLRIQGNYGMEANCQKYNLLESVAIGDNEFVSYEAIVRLMRLNPQIKRFKVAAFNADLQVGDIAEHLPNLEELILFQSDSDLNASTVHTLQRFKKLQNLRLMRIDPGDFDGILAGLPALINLRALKVQLNTDYYEEITFSKENFISIARNIENLEEFSIANCPLDAKTMMDFVKCAENLKTLHVHDCTIELNVDMIRQLGQLRLKNKKTKNNSLKVYSRCNDDQVRISENNTVLSVF